MPKALRDAAREYTAEAIETLVKCMRQEGDLKVRTTAAIALLDRGYGKPAQSISVAGDEDGGPLRIAVEVRYIDDWKQLEPTNTEIADECEPKLGV